MTEGRQAANKFHWWVKVGVGLPVVLLAVFGLLYDPELYTGIVAVLTLPVAVAFPMLYSTLPWKATILGRALMTKARAVALLYVVGITGKYWDYPFHGYAMALVTTYLAIGISFQFVVLARIKIRADRAKLAAQVAT